MSAQIRITRDDMEAAAERIAARDGVTVEDVRNDVRNPVPVIRTCPSCGERFTVGRNDKTYCGNPCKSKSHRANGSQSGGAS